MAQQMAMMAAFEKKQQSKPSAENKPSVIIHEHITPEGIKIQIRHGDLTEEVVDVIVNAANKHLDHASGVAGAINKKGGPMIQIESDQYISKHGPLEDGASVVLGAGKLKCKHVIHAVGPIWYDGQRGEPVFLSMAIRSCLDQAHGLKLTSISIPAISTGIFKFPKPACAEIMFDTVLSFIESNKNTTLKEIRFTNYDDDTVNIFKKEFEKRYANTNNAPTNNATVTNNTLSTNDASVTNNTTATNNTTDTNNAVVTNNTLSTTDVVVTNNTTETNNPASTNNTTETKNPAETNNTTSNPETSNNVAVTNNAEKKD